MVDITLGLMAEEVTVFKGKGIRSFREVLRQGIEEIIIVVGVSGLEEAGVDG